MVRKKSILCFVALLLCLVKVFGAPVEGSSESAQPVDTPDVAAAKSPAVVLPYELPEKDKPAETPVDQPAEQPAAPAETAPAENPAETAPAAPVAPEEPVAPVAPEEPAAPVAPEEPAAPVAPEEPAAPVAPEEPVAPVAPKEPAAPVAPKEPAAPVAPEEPAAPAAPKEPAAPVAPEEPAAPVAPEEPAAPVASEEPAAPVAPKEPAAPVAPEEPAAPVAPEEPAAPVAPEEPAAPVAPVEPAAPVLPEETAAPVAPVEPAAPVLPEETAAPVAPEEPAAPAAPKEPAAPVAPKEPAAPVAPEEPAAPVAPEKQAAPVAPKEPAAPVAPKEPAAPVAPMEPAAPVAPKEPAAPVAPEEPAAPVAPKEPAAPVAPEEPAAPVAPEEPAAPVAPKKPAVPVAPEEPAAPAAPKKPAAPVAPEEPAVPVAPEEPAAPAAPKEPAAPVAPKEPAAPVAPEEPAAPDAPVEPAAPVAPEEPAAPVAPKEDEQEEDEEDEQEDEEDEQELAEDPTTTIDPEKVEKLNNFTRKLDSLVDFFGQNENSTIGFALKQFQERFQFHHGKKVKSASNSGNSFPCPVRRSPAPPTSVHRLMPGDVDVIGAMGDSISAGNGILADSIQGLFNEYRGRAWSIGGDSTYETVATLPNFIREGNSALYGYSLGMGDETNPNAHLNVAVAGATSANLVDQANMLVQRMKDSPQVDYQNHWKMVTLFIGGNDMCECDLPVEPEQYQANVQDALDILHQQLPRTFVNLVEINDMSQVADMNQGLVCSIAHQILCPCVAYPQSAHAREMTRRKVQRYQNLTEKLIASGRYATRDDFTVELQPAFKQMKPPTTPTGRPDLSYFAPDCFHFSDLGHASAAEALWNNLVEPVGYKRERWNVGSSLQCPVHDFPYFSTRANSAGRIWVEQKNQALGAKFGLGANGAEPNEGRFSRESIMAVLSALGICVALGGAVFVAIRLRKRNGYQRLEGRYVDNVVDMSHMDNTRVVVRGR